MIEGEDYNSINQLEMPLEDEKEDSFTSHQSDKDRSRSASVARSSDVRSKEMSENNSKEHVKEK